VSVRLLDVQRTDDREMALEQTESLRILDSIL
jgi:hypothetical protein